MKELVGTQTTSNKKALLQRLLDATDDISNNHYILQDIISLINWADIWTDLYNVLLFSNIPLILYGSHCEYFN